VAGRVGGVEEAVLDGKTGNVVDVFQDQSVISTIINILSDSQNAKKMGQAGKERVNTSFRWEKEILKLL